MKLIDVMKEYDKCVLRENAKLRMIYNRLIRETEQIDDCDVSEEDTEDVKECDISEEDTEDVKECDVSEEDVDECNAAPADESIDENSLLSPAAFFGVNETQDEDGISMKEFWGEDPKSLLEKEVSTDEVEPDVPAQVPDVSNNEMSIQEFFGEAEPALTDDTNESEEDKEIKESMREYRIKNRRLFKS